MSNKALNWAEKIPLPRGEKTLLLILSNKFNDKDGCCYPKTKTLAKWCSCHERSIKRYIKSLISKNIIQTKEMRNQLGHRICLKYYLNLDLNLNSLSDNVSPRDSKALVTRCPSLSDTVSKPKCQVGTKALYNKPKLNKKETKDFSLVDKNEQAQLEIFVGLKFEELRKVFEDECDLQNAKRLHKDICFKNKHPYDFAKFLLTQRKTQKLDYDKLRRNGEFVAAPCSLTKWLYGERWMDKIKPMGEKKKVNPYVKCRCGEEYLRGSYCTRCEELKKPRLTVLPGVVHG